MLKLCFPRIMGRFLHSLMIIFILSRFSSPDEIRQNQATTKDVCLFETFQPRCLKDEVILMESATYGRMSIGRCITSEEVEAHRSVVGEDSRYFGCSTDVLNIIDQKCSSKPECEIRVSDISTENVKPCFMGLNVYLELTYSCISVVDEKRSCAVTATKNAVHILGSLVSQRLCGTKTQPWNIGAHGGQKVRISLIDFAAETQSSQLCISYGVIVDKIGQRNASICRRQGTQRSKEVFVSSGSEVDLYFNLLDQKQTAPVTFLLKLEAVGCSDMIPPEDAWLKRKGDLVIIGCYSNRQTWQLSCRTGKWIGVLGNCSQGATVPTESVVELQHQATLSHDEQVLAMVAIGGCTLAICLTIICVGMVCLRKFYVQYKKKQEYKTVGYQTAAMLRDDDQDLRFTIARDAMRGNESSNVEIQPKSTSYSGFVGQDDINIANGTFGAGNRNPSAAI